MTIIVHDLRRYHTAAKLATEARRQRKEWLDTYNHIKNAPGGSAGNEHALAICEQAIAEIDEALATVTLH